MQVVFEVADVVAISPRMDIKVEYIDKTLGKIAVKRDHFAQIQEARKLRKKIEKLERKT